MPRSQVSGDPLQSRMSPTLMPLSRFAGCLGLAGTPYQSGEQRTEQGINKLGNKRGRWLMVELAWAHLRYQPHSALSQWFNQRFAHGGKRLRRVGIVALARRLAIAKLPSRIADAASHLIILMVLYLPSSSRDLASPT